jgi:hypothetical protein
VTPAEGSVPIVRLQRAEILPKPKVSARVGGAGIARVLRWSVAPRPGQVVRLVEEGDRGGQTLVTVKGGGRGTKRFITSETNSPRRQIVAEVEQDGMPRDNLTVARFSAPSPRVARSPRVRVRRRGRNVLVTWKPAFYARRYEVTATRSNGVKQYILPPAGRTRLTIKGVSRLDGVTARVVGVSPSGVRGKAAVGKLAKPKPKAKAKKRGKRRATQRAKGRR